jgi:hypothetical protein
MKNKMLRCFILLFSGTSPSFSQDLIVTSKHDSLSCKISSANDSQIFFSFSKNNTQRDSVLPMSDVIYFFRNPVLDSTKTSRKKFPYKFRICANAGYTNLFFEKRGNLTPVIPLYMEELSKTRHYSFDAAYLFKITGIGMTFTNLRTYNTLDSVMFIDERGNRHFSRITDDITLDYVGAFFLIHSHPGKKNKFTINNQFSVGLISYRNNAWMFKAYHVTGSALGLSYQLGLDFLFTKNISAGIACSAAYGKIHLEQFHVNEKVTDNFSLTSVTFRQGLTVSNASVEIGIRGYF